MQNATIESEDDIVETPWRTAFRGRCFVYLLPCRDRDVAKIGFSTDPIARMQSLHPRYFDFFDLERAALIETDYVRDARALESVIKKICHDSAISPPLVIKPAAGGRTEWFCGVHARTTQLFESSQVEDGYTLHANLADWLRARIATHGGGLFDWSAHEYQIAELLHFNANPGAGTRHEKALRAALDLCRSLNLDIATLVPAAVAHWYLWGFEGR